MAVDGGDALEGVRDIIAGIVGQKITHTSRAKSVRDDNIMGDAFGQSDVEPEVFVQADGGDRCRIEIGFGQGGRRNRHLIGGCGFIVVDGAAGIGQCAVAHAGLTAVGANHAGTVERGGLSGQ